MDNLALIGKKIGMSREFFKTGQSVPVTVLKMETGRVINVISKENREDVLSAIRNGCEIISGMHEFINNDKEFSNEAKISNVSLKDLRMPPDPPHFPIGSWKERRTPVLLIVGTDCDSGKMTTAWEVAERLKKRGRAVEFVGTGQTGILLSGSGVPIDAVKADFMAGEIEKAIDDAIIRDPELIIVEGQGSLTNQYYAGVTLGLLHGAMPDYMLMLSLIHI